MKIRSLIIDDEPLAQRVIERYAEKVPFIEIVCKCNNAIEAIEILHNQKIDVIFLDINMPRLTGMEFLKSLKSPPLVIITTAYAEYAVEGFDMNVVDYLMKPFSFERFLKAIQKTEDMLDKSESLPLKIQETENAGEDFIFIKSSRKTYKIHLKEILYIEALGDYVKIHLQDKMIVSYQSLKNIENLLPPRQFPRIHKSFIISLSKTEVIEGNQVKIRDKMIPIGTNYKSEFEKIISRC
jgi:DNA-binding LytR/AlgR family response regulator